jgi:hypothetical protein
MAAVILLGAVFLGLMFVTECCGSFPRRPRQRHQFDWDNVPPPPELRRQTSSEMREERENYFAQFDDNMNLKHYGLRYKKLNPILLKIKEITSRYKDDIDKINASSIIEKLSNSINMKLDKINDAFLDSFYNSIFKTTSLMEFVNYLNMQAPALNSRYNFDLNRIESYLEKFIIEYNIPDVMSRVLKPIVNLVAVELLDEADSPATPVSDGLYNSNNYRVQDALMAYGVKKSCKRKSRKRKSKKKKRSNP